MGNRSKAAPAGNQQGDSGTGAVVAGVMGLAIMVALGLVYREFGVLKPLGFWPSVGLALPVASAIGRMRERASDYTDALIGSAGTIGWGLMIALGIVHHEFDAVRPLGFWPSVGLVLPVAAIVAAVQERESDGSRFPSGIFGGTLVLGWAIMLAVGVVSHEFGVVNAYGFLPCAAIGFGVAAALDDVLPDRRPSITNTGSAPSPAG